jgi:hypothetical protein
MNKQPIKPLAPKPYADDTRAAVAVDAAAAQLPCGTLMIG